MTDIAKAMPPFEQIVAARKAHVDAVNAYNDKYYKVEAARKNGDFSQNLSEEYTEMEHAHRRFIAIAQRLADEALAETAGN